MATAMYVEMLEEFQHIMQQNSESCYPVKLETQKNAGRLLAV
jgi:hypothetical protein